MSDSAVVCSLTPGRIRYGPGAVVQQLDEEYAKAWEIDLDSKYPATPWYGSSGPDEHGHMTHIVFIPADEHTLRIDDVVTHDTAFTIYGLPEDWIVMATAARYTVRVVAYHPMRHDDDA